MFSDEQRQFIKDLFSEKERRENNPEMRMIQSDVERAYRRRFAYCSFHRLLIEFNSLNDDLFDEDDLRMTAVNILLPYNGGI